MPDFASVIRSHANLCAFVGDIVVKIDRGVRLATVQETPGSGTRTILNRYSQALGMQPVDVRPGLLPYNYKGSEWSELVIGPFPTTMIIVDAGEIADASGRETLEILPNLIGAANPDYITLIVVVVTSLEMDEAIARVAAASGIEEVPFYRV